MISFTGDDGCGGRSSAWAADGKVMRRLAIAATAAAAAKMEESACRPGGDSFCG